MRFDRFDGLGDFKFPLKFIESFSPLGIVTDLSLPLMNGLEERHF
jgi:hypothetical protein